MFYQLCTSKGFSISSAH